MVRLLLFVICDLLFLSGVSAQDIEFESLNKLPVSINTTSCDEIMPLLSPDGKTLYFARVCQGEASDIWFSENNAKSRTWSFNDRGNNAIVGTSVDGQTIYQINTSPARKIKGVYLSKKTDGKWSAPVLEPIPFMETEEYFGIYVVPDLQTVIASMKREDGVGEEDLYVSHKKGGKWSEPVNLGSTINSIGFEISPFLSADGKRLYFASNGHRGLGGSDIFYADRLDDTWTRWSAPVNLGNVINTEGFDAYFTMNDSIAFFSSSNGTSSDIYRANIKRPEDESKLQVNNIIEDAASMIADLTDDTYDSLSSVSQSAFVTFEKGTAVLSGEAV
ncbi:MAG: hypothetical protein WDO15_20435 [Bacteroidota bacterium]